ncbi:fibronectin type III domain-containing protein [Curtobacterium flaccumfaciens]|nr:fibronectin type III domain-containing protein [Curtobacterium flaccumfaciens]
MSADFVPAPPKGITVTPSKSTPNQLDVKWGKVSAPNNGSAVDDYIVSIEGPGLSTTRHTGTATNTSFTGAQSAAQYKVTVSARNDADRNGTVVQWNSASATGSAVGTPGVPTLNASRDASPGAHDSRPQRRRERLGRQRPVTDDRPVPTRGEHPERLLDHGFGQALGQRQRQRHTQFERQLPVRRAGRQRPVLHAQPGGFSAGVRRSGHGVGGHRRRTIQRR